MSKTPRRPRHALLWSLAAIIIVADQLTKAFFVYRLGTHSFNNFGAFLSHYFSLWGDGAGELGVIRENFWPFAGLISVWDPWIEFRLTTNTGAAWSMFEGNSFALSFVSIAIAGLLLYVWLRNFRYKLGMTIAIGGIIGGALGNSIDRFRLREVVDFVSVHIPYIGRVFKGLGEPYDFPIFNVADAAAVCGTLALAGYLLYKDFGESSARRQRDRDLKRAHEIPIPVFPGGLQLDDEAKQNLKELDTTSLPRWQPEEVTDDASTAVEEEDVIDAVAAIPDPLHGMPGDAVDSPIDLESGDSAADSGDPDADQRP
jgi:signal peptidase II